MQINDSPILLGLEKPARQDQEKLVAIGSEQTKVQERNPDRVKVASNTCGWFVSEGDIVQVSPDKGVSRTPKPAARRGLGRAGSTPVTMDSSQPRVGNKPEHLEMRNWSLPSLETFLVICL